MNAKEAKRILSLYRNLSFFDKLHIYIRLLRLPFEDIEKYVSQKGKILDFGCGHGFFSLYLSKKSSERRILGIDVAKKKIDIALNSRHSNKVNFKYAPKSTSFLQKKKAFNSIVAINVLYLVSRNDQKKILQKTKEALIPGGNFLLIEPDASLKLKTFYEIIRESIMLKILRKTEGSSLTFNTKEWWIENLKKYFKKIECKKLANKEHHILYICSK